MASGKNGPPTTTNSGNMYSISLFMIAVCGSDASMFISRWRATDRRLVMWVAMPARIVSGMPHQMIASRTPSMKASWSPGMVMKPTRGAPPGSLALPIETTSL